MGKTSGPDAGHPVEHANGVHQDERAEEKPGSHGNLRKFAADGATPDQATVAGGP